MGERIVPRTWERRKPNDNKCLIKKPRLVFAVLGATKVLFYNVVLAAINKLRQSALKSAINISTINFGLSNIIFHLKILH